MNIKKITLPSPAKINHFLHIVGRREDGYHLLQTLFQFLEYGDLLHFSVRNDSRIEIAPAEVMGIATQDNLIYQAASLLQSYSKTSQGVDILLEKHLPLGAGLGGGSSNAATTLIALNYLWDIHLSSSELQRLGLSLGADVPIFLEGHAAWGEGIGEKLTRVEIPESWILVITPACHVSTPKIFAHPELTRNTTRFRIQDLARNKMNSFLEGLNNDFEPLVRKLYPEVNDAMKWLSDYGKARLSGSGASVFSCFPSQEAAQKVAQQLPPSFKSFITKGTNTSTLISAIEKLGLKDHWGVAKR